MHHHHLSQLQPETQNPRGKMANIAASNDSHDRSARESERSPPLTSHQPVVPRHELEATEVTECTEVTCGAWPLGPHQEGQVTPCDQQQEPQANQAAVAATEAAAQPQALPTSDQPSESVPMSPLTSPLAAPARTPDARPRQRRYPDRPPDPPPPCAVPPVVLHLPARYVPAS